MYSELLFSTVQIVTLHLLTAHILVFNLGSVPSSGMLDLTSSFIHFAALSASTAAASQLDAIRQEIIKGLKFEGRYNKTCCRKCVNSILPFAESAASIPLSSSAFPVSSPRSNDVTPQKHPSNVTLASTPTSEPSTVPNLEISQEGSDVKHGFDYVLFALGKHARPPRFLSG
ncbi:hypothetical protein R3P38DRAFT_3282181 [Favolaschia claudopus]|uniref:Uncharacterized protein n=1 Tax=Favolaschia claudopus TaxID=2862362 RepID=A0AAW0AD87_9AGAR